MQQTDSQTALRLDKWLWAARFYKTRALATQAVVGGKVHLNNESVKPAHSINVGDTLLITQGVERWEVGVLAVSGRRGPARLAQSLYAETPYSKQKRQAHAEERRLLKQSIAHPQSRPDKKARRQIIRFKTRNIE